MIYVLKGQEGVEGCINGGGDAICAKRTEGIQFDHLIFEFLPAVAVDEIFELLQVQNCEAFAIDRSQIAAASLDGQDASEFSGKRIWQLELGACIATTKIRNP